MQIQISLADPDIRKQNDVLCLTIHGKDGSQAGIQHFIPTDRCYPLYIYSIIQQLGKLWVIQEIRITDPVRESHSLLAQELDEILRYCGENYVVL